MKNKKLTKLKDLPKDTQLCNLKIKIPKKIQISQSIPSSIMIIYSGWNKGLWLKKNINDEQIYPLCFENFNEIKKLEVIDSYLTNT